MKPKFLKYQSHKLRGNDLNRYRSLVEEGKDWKNLEDIFKKFFLTEERREKHSDFLEYLSFRDLQTGNIEDEEELLELVRKKGNYTVISIQRTSGSCEMKPSDQRNKEI